MVTCSQQRLTMLPLVPINPFAVAHKITATAANIVAKTNTITQTTTTHTTNTKPKLAFSIDALVGSGGGGGVGGVDAKESNRLVENSRQNPLTTPHCQEHIKERSRVTPSSPTRHIRDDLPCVEPLELRNSFREVKTSLSPAPPLAAVSHTQNSPVIRTTQESGNRTPISESITSPLREQTQSPTIPNEPLPATSSRSTTPLNSPREIEPLTADDQRIFKIQPQLPPGLVRPFPMPAPGTGMPLIRPIHSPGGTPLTHPPQHSPSNSLLAPPPNVAPPMPGATANPHLLAAQFQMAAVLAHHQQQQQQQQQAGPHNPNIPPSHAGQPPPHLPPHLMHGHHLGIFPPVPHHAPFGNPHLIRDSYPLYPWLLSRHGRIFSHRFPGFLLQPFRKPKRVRTAFSPTQLLKLEHAFEENHYVVGAERKQLAQNLNLTETQVKVWFQNRRTKHKRMQQEGDSDTKSQKGSQSGDNEGKNDSSQTSFEDQDELEMADGDEVGDEEEDEVIDMDDYDDHEMDAEERKRMTEHFQEMQNRHFAHSQMFQQQSQQHQQFLQQHFLQQQHQQQQQLYAQSEHQRQQQQQQLQQQNQERHQQHQQQPATQKH